ncbi:uncharacterized protein LOC134818505 [Bolinopsis microptera]|uniref:uncharacterized protein LOC134818505 n=1 Tax=Bolinopsis microptera TaxID=2820187 RepID=UPI0030799034
MTMYIDGAQQQPSSGENSDWREEKIFKISDSFKTIAIHCYDRYSEEGILASVEEEGGEEILVTDSTWRCSSVEQEGWTKAGFQEDVDVWKPAEEIGNHGMDPWGVIGKISGEAKWIWDDSETRSDYINSYCRFTRPIVEKINSSATSSVSSSTSTTTTPSKSSSSTTTTPSISSSSTTITPSTSSTSTTTTQSTSSTSTTITLPKSSSTPTSSSSSSKPLSTPTSSTSSTGGSSPVSSSSSPKTPTVETSSSTPTSSKSSTAADSTSSSKTSSGTTGSLSMTSSTASSPSSSITTPTTSSSSTYESSSSTAATSSSSSSSSSTSSLSSITTEKYDDDDDEDEEKEGEDSQGKEITVEVSSREVLLNTPTTLTCKIKRITQKMSIKWTGFAEGDESKYVKSSGSYDLESNSQTGTLTVQSPSDKTYTCTVSSIQNTESDRRHFDVHLNVYEVIGQGAEVMSGTAAAISCVITGITHQVSVEWLDPSGNVISDDPKYTINPGAVDNSIQTATLEVTGAAVTEDSTFTCRVTSGQFPHSPPSNTDVQITVHACNASGDMDFNDTSFICVGKNDCNVKEQLPDDLGIVLKKDVWYDGEIGEISYSCKTGSIMTCTEWECGDNNPPLLVSEVSGTMIEIVTTLEVE